MIEWLLVGVGGAAGSAARYGLMAWWQRRGSSTWPSAILAANVVGSFVLGILLAMWVPTAIWLLAAVGFCGGLTTFSSFAADVLTMTQHERSRRAAVYVIASVGGALVALVAGLEIGRVVSAA